MGLARVRAALQETTRRGIGGSALDAGRPGRAPGGASRNRLHASRSHLDVRLCAASGACRDSRSDEYCRGLLLFSGLSRLWDRGRAPSIAQFHARHDRRTWLGQRLALGARRSHQAPRHSARGTVSHSLFRLL